VTDLYYPLQSLREGNWFKLICGASYQHLPAVRNLVLAYALAGVDCVDVAADPAVVLAAKEALGVAAEIVTTETTAAASERFQRYRGTPLLMVSLNDGEDPHFRKAELNAANCPTDCSRPCEAICPAQAIAFSPTLMPTFTPQQSSRVALDATASGVLSDRCYGCGRCLPVCPIQQIETRSHVASPSVVAPLVLQNGVDALEIHTQIGRQKEFQQLWAAIAPWLDQLKVVAISCPDGEGLLEYLWALYELIAPLPCALIWQTDGRPMSGDLGVGATRASIQLGQKVLAAGLPGYVQLAGGTNHHTVPKLRSLGLLKPRTTDEASCRHEWIAGVAYGSYARALLAPVLNELEAMEMSAIAGVNDRSQRQATATLERSQSIRLEHLPHQLWQAVALAESLVAQLKPANAVFNLAPNPF